jgi:thiamine biosynthesis lipoprotein
MMRRAQPWLGTLVDIAIADQGARGDQVVQAAHAAAMARAFAAIAEVHALMSFHDPASDVSRLNRALPGEEIMVDPRTAQVLAAALSLARETDGLFNPLCAPRLVEWRYLPAPVPASGLAGAMPDWTARPQALALHGCRVIKQQPAWIDLGGIAKGYAVDAAVEALRDGGVRSACVNAGGDLRAFGEAAWPVLLRDPRQPGRAISATSLRDGALATSAITFSRRAGPGRESSALVHGRDGTPLLREASVSVSAPDCMMADALTKVVAANGDAAHPALARHGAAAVIFGAAA